MGQKIFKTDTQRADKYKTIENIINAFIGKEYLFRSRSLDLGCATGYGSAHFAHVCKWIVGLDVDYDYLQLAHSRYDEANLCWICQDCIQLPFYSNTFDLVIYNGMIMYAQDPRRILLEIQRVLKSEGYCYISSTNRYRIIARSMYYTPYWIYWFPKFLYKLYRKMAKNYFPMPAYYFPLSWKELMDVCGQFEIHDITFEVISHNENYGITIPKIIKLLPLFLLKRILIFSSVFILLLRKKGD